MGLPQNQLSLTEFLVWEHDKAERHDCDRGEVFAVVSARRG
jgi:hypothetical protein